MNNTKALELYRRANDMIADGNGTREQLSELVVELAEALKLATDIIRKVQRATGHIGI